MDSSGEPPSVFASSHRYTGWVMLDPYVRLNRPAINSLETYAEAETSKGDHISVSFHAVPPPKVSRLYVNWKPSGRHEGGTDEGESSARSSGWRGRIREVEPKVVAAHGNSILLDVTVDRYKDRCSDFFVYRAHRTCPPSLWRLPECGYKLYTDFAGINHMESHEDIGIVCHDDKEFVVADLQSIMSKQFYYEVFEKSQGLQFYDKETPTPLDVQLCIFSSPDWYFTQPQIHRIHHEEGQGEELLWWSNDAVVPCGDSLYYVDYLRGILFANVLSEFPEQLHYIRLPVELPTGEGNRESPEMFRSLCATKDGIMKFVDVDVCTTVVIPSGRRSSSFTINLWKLIRDANDSMKWEKESALRDCELRSLQGYNNDLQHSVPQFPLVSMEEPNTIFFVLNNHCFKNSDPWIIMVDMMNKTLLSSFKYTTAGFSFKYDDDMMSRNLFFNRPFIPCEFSKYLQVPETRKRNRE